MSDEQTYGFNKDDADALIQSIGNGEGWLRESRPRGGHARVQVIMSAELVAATDTETNPSTAIARILRKEANGNLTLSTDEITVVNRFQNISVGASTYAKAEWIDGEWQLYAADCP